MDVPKTAFFLLVTLFSVAVISEASEGQTGPKVEMRDKITTIEKMLDEVSVVGIKKYQRGFSYEADSVEGPKDEIRDKITKIKKMLNKVSELAEICGGCDSNPCLNGGTCIDTANGKYRCSCADNWKGNQCEKCNTALGMESGKIKDDQITASPSRLSCPASRGRLNYKLSSGKVGSWCSNAKNPWFQVDLGSGNRNVSGIATQGGTNDRGIPRWVEKYKLMYSDDGVNFQYYNDGGASGKVFIANKNRDTVVYNELSQPITSRYIRIIPMKGKKKQVAMRLELYGCQEKPCDSSPCFNGGNCTNEADGNFTCHCESGWTGETCQQIKPCDSSPCFNGGNCTNEADGNFTCHCESGWTGETCQQVKPCDSSPCLNGGICTNEADGNFTCHCESGWTGETCQVGRNCAELYKSGERSSGVYTIDPDGSGAFDVFCDQTTAGGGWTVFQKRLDGSVNFYRGWSYYKQGFGNLNGEYWLGLDKIHRLTKLVKNTLRVDLENTESKTAYAAYAAYDMFAVTSERTKYHLSLGTYSGTAGNSLAYHNGNAFSTMDKDNDRYPGNCAAQYKGAWWYRSCYVSNLNGRYYYGKHSYISDGINWDNWSQKRATRAEMKIRPIGF